MPGFQRGTISAVEIRDTHPHKVSGGGMETTEYRVAVEAWLLGGLAVHRGVRAQDKGQWVITHIASGLGVVDGFHSCAGAKAAALDLLGLIDWTKSAGEVMALIRPLYKNVVYVKEKWRLK